MPDPDSYDIAVSGAGMVGAALALALAREGWRVVVAERRSAAACAASDPYQRISLVNAAAAEFLTDLGIDVTSLGTPVVRMRVWDQEWPGSIQLDAEDQGLQRLGYMVENRRLEQALHGALRRSGAALHYDTQWQAGPLQDGHRLLYDGRGTRIVASLLAIAEGRESSLRDQCAPAPIWREDYRQQAITATIWTERPHAGVAYQRFLPTGPLAVLPFSDDAEGRPRASIVWSARNRLARQLLALPDAQFLCRLQESFGAQLGRFTAIGKRGHHPLSALHLSRYRGERVVVLGDSAHGVHPLAGLGVNLGFRDVAALRLVLLEAQRQRRDWGSAQVLAQYEARRRPDNLITVLTCGALNHLFSNRSTALAGLRDIGLLGSNLIPPVKAFFIRQATGL
ncbi:MAG: FAD-dependent monooxygenase [Acidithiobacillus sp.]